MWRQYKKHNKFNFEYLFCIIDGDKLISYCYNPVNYFSTEKRHGCCFVTYN